MSFPTTTLVWWLPAIIPSYLILCSSLRYRRRIELQKKFPDQAALAKMTTVEAQVIVNKLVELEFPLTVLTSLQFALFKVSISSSLTHLRWLIPQHTYGIPTISQLLVDTQQLAHKDHSSKRYVPRFCCLCSGVVQCREDGY